MLEKAIRDVLDPLDDEEYSVRIISWNTLVTHDYVLSRDQSLDAPISRENIAQCVNEAFRKALGGEALIETPFVVRKVA